MAEASVLANAGSVSARPLTQVPLRQTSRWSHLAVVPFKTGRAATFVDALTAPTVQARYHALCCQTCIRTQATLQWSSTTHLANVNKKIHPTWMNFQLGIVYGRFHGIFSGGIFHSLVYLLPIFNIFQWIINSPKVYMIMKPTLKNTSCKF